MKKIMVIDDNMDFANMFTEYMSDADCRVYKCVEFKDEEEIILKIKEILPDIIVLDVNLTKTSGISIINRLKKEPSLSKISIIIATASAYNSVVEGLVKNEKNVLGFYSKLEIDVIRNKIINER